MGSGDGHIAAYKCLLRNTAAKYVTMSCHYNLTQMEVPGKSGVPCPTVTNHTRVLHKNYAEIDVTLSGNLSSCDTGPPRSVLPIAVISVAVVSGDLCRDHRAPISVYVGQDDQHLVRE